MMENKYIVYCDTPTNGEIIFMGNDLNEICDLVDVWYESLTSNWLKCDLKEGYILSGHYKFLIYKRGEK